MALVSTASPPPAWSPAPDLDVFALRTPTLPPATATNTVLAEHAPFIVDPATPFDAERSTLLAALDARTAAGRTPRAIVLTHHHADHVGAAAWLASRAGLPIWAHARTAALLEGVLEVDRALEPGEQLGTFTIHHTPGHASGHIVLHDAARGILIAGDMVATIGTIIVDPPDGHMASYLASLRALMALGAKLLVPAHGAPIEGAAAVTAHLSHYLAHRAQREAQVLAALGPEPRSLDALTRAAYPELASPLLPLARRSALAHLIKLAEDELAAETPDGWCLALTPPRTR